MAVKHEPVVVRSWLDFDTGRFDPGLDCSVEPSMTKQSFRDECDINTIMSRYERTGVMPESRGDAPQFGDYISEYSFQESMNAVIYAQQQFADLPARVRDRFGNDPANMLRFLEDDKNREEAIKLGLVQPPPVDPPPQRVEVVNPAPPPDPDSAPKPPKA